MGFISLLTGWDQDKAAGNAVLVSHLLLSLDRQQKRNIAGFMANHVIKSGYRGTVEDVLRALNRECRVTQLNCVACACENLGIAPPINDDVGWRSIKNPFVAGGHTKSRWIDANISYIKKTFGIDIDWPGDEVRVDFLAWYAGQAG